MTGSNDRPVSILDRPTVPSTAVHDRYSDAHAAPPDSQRAVRAAGRNSAAVARSPAAASPGEKPLPLGWGSHEDRRIMLWAVLGFFLLGVYAAAFVVLGAAVWS